MGLGGGEEEDEERKGSPASEDTLMDKAGRGVGNGDVREERRGRESGEGGL